MLMVIKYVTKSNKKTLENGKVVAKDLSKVKVKEIDDIDIGDFIYDNGCLLLSKSTKEAFEKKEKRKEDRANLFLNTRKKKIIAIVENTKLTTLKVDKITYPLDRASIQKFTETLNACKLGNRKHVRLNGLDGEVKLTIAKAEVVVNALAMVRMDAYWDTIDKVKEINAVTTSKELEKITY